MNKKMSNYKKMLLLVAAGLLLLSVFAVIPSLAEPPAGPLADIKSYLESWFGVGGTYSKTPQIVTGSLGVSITEPDPHMVFQPSTEGPAYKITITIRTSELGAGEALQIVYYLGSVNPPSSGRILCYETIAIGSDIHPAKTYEYCASGEAPFMLKPAVDDGFEVFYSYIVTYEPSE